MDPVFYLTTAYADVGSLKSLHTLFGKHFDHILVKFEQNRMGRTIQKLALFDKHGSLFRHTHACSIDAILEDVSMTETLFSANLSIYRLSFFGVPKITVQYV